MYNPKSGKMSLKALKYPEVWLPSKEEKTLDDDDESFDKANTSVSAKKSTAAYCNRIFHDETLQTYSRRLTFSPKGEFLIVPGGILPPTPEKDKLAAKNTKTAAPSISSPSTSKGSKSKRSTLDKKKPDSNNHAVIIFCRNSFTNPCAIIPTGTSFSVAVRFSPIYYKTNRELIVYDADFVNPTKKSDRMISCVGKLKQGKADKRRLLDMPYRLVYAVITNNSVIIGDTECSQPIAVIRNIHLTRLSDLSWSADGRVLLVSSTDGYCSVITFAEHELGVPAEDVPQALLESFLIPPPPPVKQKPSKEPKKKETKDQVKQESKESKKKEPKQRKAKDSTKEEGKAKKNKKTEFKKAEVESNVKLDADNLDPAAGPNSNTTDGVKAVPAEKSHEKSKTPKSKVAASTTPRRNTLDKWIIKTKTPKPGESSSVCQNASSTMVANSLSNEQLSSPNNLKVSSKKSPVEIPFVSSATSITQLITPEQIRNLESAPIIVDLESDDEDVSEVKKLLDSSKDKIQPQLSHKTDGNLESNGTPGKVTVGEKRPATSPLTSQQKPKQPRRITLITLSSSATTSDGVKEEGRLDG